jgi:hypothetical protein
MPATNVHNVSARQNFWGPSTAPAASFCCSSGLACRVGRGLQRAAVVVPMLTSSGGRRPASETLFAAVLIARTEGRTGEGGRRRRPWEVPQRRGHRGEGTHISGGDSGVIAGQRVHPRPAPGRASQVCLRCDAELVLCAVSHACRRHWPNGESAYIKGTWS